MRYSTTSGMILAAMTFGEAVAGPAHAHIHRHTHQKKDADWEATIDWNALGIDWSSAWAAGQHTSTSAAPVPTSTALAATTTTAAAAPAQTSAASGNKLEGVFNEVAYLFGGLVGIANNFYHFGTAVQSSGPLDDSYPGNYGDPYCSNMYIVTNGTIPPDALYTNTFSNNQSSHITVNIWNKRGPDGQPQSGSALAPKSTCLTFVLQPGVDVIVAFAANSEIGWAESLDSYTESGAFQTSWGEAQLGNPQTGSAYDLSAIVDPNKNYNMAINSNMNCLSDPWHNSWKTASSYVGTSDGSCWVPLGNPVHMTTTMGGTF